MRGCYQFSTLKKRRFVENFQIAKYSVLDATHFQWLNTAEDKKVVSDEDRLHLVFKPILRDIFQQFFKKKKNIMYKQDYL